MSTKNGIYPKINIRMVTIKQNILHFTRSSGDLKYIIMLNMSINRTSREKEAIILIVLIMFFKIISADIGKIR